MTMFIPRYGDQKPTISRRKLCVTTALKREIEAYQRILEDLRREKIALLSRAVDAEEKHVSAIETLKRERENYSLTSNSALKEAKGAIQSMTEQLNNRTRESTEYDSMKRQLAIERDLRQRAETQVRQLQFELSAKKGRIQEFDEKSAALEQQVNDAMEAVKSAFSGYTRETEKSKALQDKVDDLEYALSHAHKKADDYRRDSQKNMKMITNMKNNQSILGAGLSNVKTTGTDMTNLTSLGSKSSSNNDQNDAQSQIINVLRKEVQSLRTKLVEQIDNQKIQYQTKSISATNSYTKQK